MSLEFSTTRETRTVCHAATLPNNFHTALLALDTAIIEETRESGCPACGAWLCRADYPRKPWGVDARYRHLYARRFSLCCSRDGCRGRVTPDSARFLGRRRYPGFWVILITALSQGTRRRHCRQVCQTLGLHERTLTRWRAWWREQFPQSPFWRIQRSRVTPPPQVFPADLLAAFDDRAQRGRLLTFLAWWTGAVLTASPAQGDQVM